MKSRLIQLIVAAFTLSFISTGCMVQRRHHDTYFDQTQDRRHDRRYRDRDNYRNDRYDRNNRYEYSRPYRRY